MAIYLLYIQYHDNSTSFQNIQPYFDVLPDQFTTLLQFKENEWDLLKETSVHKLGKPLIAIISYYLSCKVKQRRKEILNAVEFIYDKLFYYVRILIYVRTVQ
jgi:hypothetical protein